MTTKSEITNEINRLKQFGWSVLTANSKNPLPIGLKGFCDHLVIGKKGVIWWEAKIGKDKPSQEQEDLMIIMSFLSTLPNSKILDADYLTEINYKSKVQEVINKYGVIKCKN
jgi:hypothetical protein